MPNLFNGRSIKIFINCHLLPWKFVIFCSYADDGKIIKKKQSFKKGFTEKRPSKSGYTFDLKRVFVKPLIYIFCDRWETMYRAEVDLQRIRQWLKIDEIFDEERRIKTAMSSRAGIVSLLLHQTTAHDPRCLDMRTKPTVTKKPAYRLMI